MKYFNIFKKTGVILLLSAVIVAPALASTSDMQTVDSENLLSNTYNYTVLNKTGDDIGWGSSINYANEIKNDVQVKYTSANRTAVEIKNNDFSAIYNLNAEKRLVSSFKNANGQTYFTDTHDAFVSSSNGTYFSSSTDTDTYFNIFRLGYYYYDVHVLGQGISSGAPTINTRNAYNILRNSRRSWNGNEISNISSSTSSLSYVVSNTYDPYCYTQNVSFSTSTYNAIQITLKAETATSCQIYFYTEAYGGFNAAQCVSFAVIPGQQNTYTVALDSVPNYTGNVKGVRIDCGNSVGETISITSMKAVYAENLAPSVRLERTFHTYSDKLHEELRFIATESITDIRNVGVQTKIPVSEVSQYILGNGESYFSSVSDVNGDIVCAAFDTSAGIFGYIVPKGENMGSITVSITDGYYVISRSLPVASMAADSEVKLSSRIYNDASHDFTNFIKQAYLERNPLTSDNITVNEGFDEAFFLGYDVYTGAYAFTSKGESFNGAYYGRPDYHFRTPITITCDDNDRRIYIRSGTEYGSLECSAVIDNSGNLLPIPVEVCKNFQGEIEEPIYYPDDVAYGEVYFPLTLKAYETKAFTVVHLYQNWGKYPLKQLSSIQFFAPYYHLSSGVTETNCIAPYFVIGKDGWTLPDFRALSSTLWTDQPQHYSGGHIFFLNYTDSDGNTNKSESQSANINSAGPLYADIDMEYLSDDGKIKAEYKHVELPQTDENRTYYQIKLTVLEDISFDNFKEDFSFVAFDGRHIFYTQLNYLDENGNVANKTLTYNTNTVDYIKLGKESPFFCYYLREGTSTQVINMALIVKNSDITINGEKYDGNFILKNTYLANMNYGALTLDLEKVTLKKGDELIINTVLLPWGDPDDTDITSVLNVRNDSCIDPYKLEVSIGEDISEQFLPSVRADKGISEFTISGGDNNAAVRVYGFENYTIEGIYELVNGEYVKYDTSVHGYDGYQVYLDKDGTYSFSFIIDMSDKTPRTFKVVQCKKGDVNNDGTVNSKDILRLKKYLSDPTIDIQINAAYLNEDSVIDFEDYTALWQMVH